MIAIEINTKQLEELKSAVGKAKKSFGKELAKAINKTAKDTRLNMGREIRSKLNLKKKEVEKIIRVRNASAESLRSVVFLDHQERGGFGLQHFGARQNGKGVSYAVSPGKRKTIAGAFIGSESGPLHGGVFKRIGAKRKMTKGRYQGQVRQPIVKLYGASAFGAYKKNNFEDVEPVFIRSKLEANMTRSIRENVLRANGLIPK